MARTSNIFIRIEPDIKEQAESVLEKLGIPMSNAVAIFLRQIVMQNGLPFEVKIPNKKANSLSNSAETESSIKIKRTKDDIDNRVTHSRKDIGKI